MGSSTPMEVQERTPITPIQYVLVQIHSKPPNSQELGTHSSTLGVSSIMRTFEMRVDAVTWTTYIRLHISWKLRMCGMEKADVLVGSRVKLRPPEERDKAERLILGRDPEIHRMFGGSANAAPLSWQEVEAEFEGLASDPYAWVIEFQGRFIGVARLHSLNEEDRRARYAVGIHDPMFVNKGLGTEVTELVLAFAFEVLGLHRVDLRVLEYNQRAIRSYEKSGFRKEGLERESALVDSQWYGDVIMGILAGEWRTNRQSDHPVLH